ncbi:uncharacterized protein LOC23687434 [Aedes aegypti]|uniref:Uncharacterized protein n=1 Tax=Aedes aegypti TaxID=7159 RepID=A0A6I8TLE6_AEDAE|nr:odorant receptor 105 [Aedes aegypti]
MVNHLRLVWNRVFKYSSSEAVSVSKFWSDDGTGGDCYWLLDAMSLLAGVRSDSTSNWVGERKIRIFSNCLFVFGISMLALEVLSDMYDRWDDNSVKVMALLKLTSICLACLKTAAIVLLRKPIETLRTFILSERVNSSDHIFDELERSNVNQTGRTMMRAMLGLIVVEMILLSIPNQTMDNVFRMAPLLLRMGEPSARVLHVLFMCSLPLFLLPRLFSNIAYIGILILGMRMRLKMLTHRYHEMLRIPDSDVDYYLEIVNKKLRKTLCQHMEFMRQFSVLTHLVRTTFMITHYYSIFSIGAIIFMWQNMGFNGFSTVFLLTFVSLLLEYYVWCYLVDSFQEVANSIGVAIYEMCVHMPHSHDHHSRYIQLRTSLIIIWINNSNGYSVNCFGLLKPSILAFVDLVNITYSMLMFLINMG